MAKFITHESIAYHAARILILIAYCGKPRGRNSSVMPAIEGRTLLAKLDFFLRYPLYLEKASEILKKKEALIKIFETSSIAQNSVESKMVRYKYGPWDHLYYVILGYLTGKELINVESSSKSDVFRITESGMDVAIKLSQEAEYDELIKTAELVYKLFNSYSGNHLKNFIYENFPEVVNRKIGEEISITDKYIY